MHYFQITFREELTEKFFTIIINKALFSFEDAILEAEKKILLYDTSVNHNRLMVIDAKVIINVISIIK